MGNAFIALVFGVGAGTWVGSWFYKRTGGNPQKSYSAGAVTGILVFIVLFTIISQIS